MKLSYTTLLLVALALSAPARAQTPIVIQAESGVLTDRDPTDANGPAEVRTTDSNVSGATGPYVALQGGVITLDISSVPRGQYTLSTSYASPFGEKIERVDVDGVRYFDRSDQCGGGTTFQTRSVFGPKAITSPGRPNVTVSGSTGTLVVTSCFGFTYFDTFTLTPVTPPPANTSSFTIQAESGILTDRDPTDTNGPAVVRTNDSQVSGATGPYVALQGGVITLDISAIPAGQYRLTTSYASPFGEKIERIDVDGVRYSDNLGQCGGGSTFPSRTVFGPKTIGSSGTATVTVNGNTGTLVVTSCFGFTYFDFFTLTPVATVAKTVFDGPGYRLLSAPVQELTVGTLASLNLVQGIPGQYPSAGANLYTGYTGTSYTAPAGQSDMLEPGRGFFWFFYDRNVSPQTTFGGGTSRSFELSNFTLNATGPVLTESVQRAFPLNATNGFYMIGNPFARALPPSGVTLVGGGGTLTTNLQAFDPNGNTYRMVTGAMSPWQGVFAEVTGGTAPTFAFDYAATTAATPTLIGKTDEAGSRLELALTGEAGGAVVTDHALVLRLEGDATTGWDRHDGSKMPSPGASPLLAIRGERLGETAYKAVESLPTTLDAETTLALAFTTPAAGTFTLAAPDGNGFPDGWRVEARDLTTGARADLTAGEVLSFTSDATDWTDRFVLVVTAGRPVAVGDTPAGTFEVGSVAPNPAAGRARISVQTGTPQDVSVRVYDVLGREVARLHEGPLSVGTATFDVETAGLAPGAYVIRVSGASAQAVRRFTVVR